MITEDRIQDQEGEKKQVNRSTVTVDGVDIPCYAVNTLVIGSGAASLNSAVQLHALGQKNIMIVTDQWGGGTSNNAGSDKQTYYKMSLGGSRPDSAGAMARDLFAGGCMHGDIALCEAQNSLRAFFHLVQIGVPFPHDRFGSYVGFKTDNDPRQRGTSAGPLTSQNMCRCLGREVRRREIPVMDRYEVIGLLTVISKGSGKVIGALALDKTKLGSPNNGIVVFNAVNIVLGTGGPAGLYRDSVYPVSQTGSHGLAFAIGASGQNLTESQFGLASLKFRWNLSGSYQQAIPRYISTDKDGGDEREFLNPFFPNMRKLTEAIFLKGYEWPFDPRRVAGWGSSLIDILVYRETSIQGRRVFLDYRQNPTSGGDLDEFSLDKLGKEARSYLEKSCALLSIPIERLKALNQPAVDLFKDRGIDLNRESLEIAVCAQHNNGGLKGNLWWESNIRHLFPVGEANGSHGVYRPGGAALNAGQVGGLRAAQFITAHYGEKPPDTNKFIIRVQGQIRDKIEQIRLMLETDSTGLPSNRDVREKIQKRMSSFGGLIRNPEKVEAALRSAWVLYQKLTEKGAAVRSVQELPAVFKNRDLCLTHVLYLEALREYLKKGGRSRGSFLVLDRAGKKPCPQLEEEWRFSLEDGESFAGGKILEIRLNEKGTVMKNWTDVRPLPEENSWFETIWKDFREGRIIR